MYNICTVVGTRPEVIKLSEVIKRLDSCSNHTLVHTGQHYDSNLSDIFFSDLDLRKPDYYLEAKGNTPIELIANSMVAFDKLLAENNFDAMLIYGDTNSSICAYAAKRKRIPIFHMEAGNRCFDARVPEEINRSIIDHIADVNMVITEQARDNLIREGCDPQFTYKVGSSMPEVFKVHESKLVDSASTARTYGLKPKDYYIVSIHREENISNKGYLDELCALLEGLLDSRDVIMPMHPKTAALFGSRASSLRSNAKRKLFITEPLGFIDFVCLQKEASCTISDSGTIFEESNILGFPAVTIRDSFERPEGIEAGSIIVCSWAVDRILSAIDIVSSEQSGRSPFVLDYNAPNLSRKVVRLIVSLIDKVNSKVYSKGA